MTQHGSHQAEDQAQTQTQAEASAAASVSAIKLGDSIPTANAPLAQEERASALEDFLMANNCLPLRNDEPILGEGPFGLEIEKAGNNLGLVFSRAALPEPSFTVSFSLSPLRRALKDYAQIVESYYDAIRTGQAARIEAVDMARRGVHNEAAEILIERLEGKLRLDHDTARRLFTIIYAIRYDGKGGMR